MSRATELYKRRLQIISIVVAFVLTLLFNVDAAFLARTLWVNPELRQTVVVAATNFDQSQFAEQQASAQSVAPEPDSTPSPEATPEATPEPAVVLPADNPDVITGQVLAQNVEDVGATVQELRGLQLPIGWEYTEVTDELIFASKQLGLEDPRSNARNLWNLIPGKTDRWLSLWIQKIIGILATTIAAAQGAPFWFDILNKLARR
jgi:hypothetical protein